MKKIITVLSFVLAGILFTTNINAQSIEQISYVPVKKGNYSNLMVKKRTIIGGDLTVTNSFRSLATTLTLTANTISFADTATVRAFNDIFLIGDTATVNTVSVGAHNVFAVTAPTTNINILYLSGDRKIYAKNISVNKATITNLYVDGVLFPACNYKWETVTTMDNGSYKILTCQ